MKKTIIVAIVAISLMLIGSTNASAVCSTCYGATAEAAAGKYDGKTEAGQVICLGEEGVCFTLWSLKPTTPGPAPDIKKCLVKELSDEGSDDGSKGNDEEAIIDIGNFEAANTIEGRTFYSFAIKPTTWYGTKQEAMAWIYEQLEMLNSGN
jgi:hypothetical protein